MYLTFVKISEIHEMKCENVLGIRCSNIWHTSTVWGGVGKLVKISRLAIYRLDFYRFQNLRIQTFLRVLLYFLKAKLFHNSVWVACFITFVIIHLISEAKMKTSNSYIHSNFIKLNSLIEHSLLLTYTYSCILTDHVVYRISDSKIKIFNKTTNVIFYFEMSF